MPFWIVRNDITHMKADAIVNAANPSLLGGGGVDGAIHRAAGAGLLAECRTLGGCAVGDAKITGGYDLPCRHVIHTVGPRWEGGDRGEAALLASCYRSSLRLAAENGCESVAFPLISSGIYGYPKEQAFAVATAAIRAFLDEYGGDMTVYLVVFGDAPLDAGERFAAVAAYLDARRADAPPFDARCAAAPAARERGFGKRLHRRAESLPADGDLCLAKTDVPAGLDPELARLDESFSQMLLRKVDEKGMTDAPCYKKANIDRKLFSKIRSDVHYRPSKPTALAFAVALELSREETDDLLRKAGFALSRSNKFDVIVDYFLRNGQYDIFAINEALFAFDQVLLGG